MATVQTQQQAVVFNKPVQPVEVLAMEMLTPVGMDAAQTATSIRAGISAYQASANYNKNLNPMTMALVPEEALTPLNAELAKRDGLSGRQQRMLRLATMPLKQLLEASPPQKSVPLLLAGPEKLPGRRSVISDRFLQQLKQQAEVEFDLDNSYVFPQGRAAGFYALEAAMLMIEQGIAEQVIVGAVDSYLDLLLLGRLDAEDRILAEGVMDGFAPGEGAAFMLVQAVTDQGRVRLYPPGIAKEAGHRYSEQAYKGDGLAEAVTDALSHVSNKPIQTVLAGFNGEHFNTKEWGVSLIRNSHKISSEHDIVHPADCFGDTGAALGLMLMQLGIIGLNKGYYSAPLMAWSSSELAPRAAVCMV